MLLSARSLAVLLTVLSGCVGFVEDNSTDYQPVNGQSDGTDAGRETRVDAGRADAGHVDAAMAAAAAQDVGDQDTVPEDTAAQASAGACPKGKEQPLAEGLHIREISLYQTIKVVLMKDGNWVHDGPVVQGKKSLVRVFVDPLAGYQAHNVNAVLSVQTGGTTTDLHDERTITTSSSDAQLDSTFHFDLDPSQLGSDTTMSVSLQELECGDATDGGDPNDARFPASGTQEL
ncbi:MAG TPA: hypothetical protein VG963_02895, partial [Polyangiaceae bacterium]|nr:hypothetical protein [Polyangiaceae bacterium]